MYSSYTNKKIKELKDDLRNNDYLDPMKDIIFKSILKRDKTHIIIRTVVKELLGLELYDIKELDSGFIAKGKNQRGEACDYLVSVDGKTISIECNYKYSNKLFIRNVSHLRRAIIQEDFDIIQINFDNYDFGGKKEYVYCYSLKEEKGGREAYKDLIKIFHINLPKFKKIVYNKEKELTLFEKVCRIFLTRNKKELEKLVKGDEEMSKLREILDDISTCDDLCEKYTKSELENIVVAEDMAHEMANEMARDMAKDMANDMAKDMANDMAKDMANDMAKDMTKKQTLETARKLLEKGLDISLVGECTGLKESELKNLLEN